MQRVAWVGPVEGVGGGAPNGIMWCGAMRFERGLVAVDLVEIIGVGVLPVLQHVEAEAAGLVAFGAERVDLDRLEEPFAALRLHLDLDPQCDHVRHLSVSNRTQFKRTLAPASSARELAPA